MHIATLNTTKNKTNNLVNRLQTRVELSIETLPPIKVIELPKLTELPTPKTARQRKELIYFEYKLIERRLGKKLAAKGTLLPHIKNDCILPLPLPPTQQAAVIKMKGGFMDNIGEIIDSNYNTISLPKKKYIESFNN